jgi:hypothetical protein
MMKFCRSVAFLAAAFLLAQSTSGMAQARMNPGRLQPVPQVRPQFNIPGRQIAPLQIPQQRLSRLPGLAGPASPLGIR